MSTDEYEAITEAEWKVLATTEITHLTDEEKDYLHHAWDEWIARVRRDAARSGYYRGYRDRRLERDYDYAYPEETSDERR